MSAILRVTVACDGDADAALCSGPALTLIRDSGVLYVRCADEHVAHLRVRFARAGLVAEPWTGTLASTSALIPARVGDLEPLDAQVRDEVAIRTLSLGDATRAVPRSGALWRRRPEPARTCALLRDDDRVYAWRRVVWADRAVLRSFPLRRARPMVFDRTATGAERTSFAGDGLLARWLRA